MTIFKSLFQMLSMAAVPLVLMLPGAAQADDDGAWFNQIIRASKAGESTSSRSGQRTSRRSGGANSQPLAEAADARPRRRTRLARGGEGSAEPTRRSLSGGGITWQASSGCVPGQLHGVLTNIVGSFGPVTVTSTCRGAAQNRAAGGAGQSYHLSGQAVDFRVHGSIGAVYAQLASNGSVGGLKHYGGGLFHIDTGPRRSW